MKTKLYILIISLGLTINGYSQSQDGLLKYAYKHKSVELLIQFFNNWSNEIKPISDSCFNKLNDTIKEAYLVYKAFYNPRDLSSKGRSDWGNAIYLNSKYFIIQAQLNKIQFVNQIYYTDRETDSLTIAKIIEHYKDDTLQHKLWIQHDENGSLIDISIMTFGPRSDYFKENKLILVDSIIYFRPKIDYYNTNAVFLTKEYDKILTDFLGNKYLKLGTEGIMNPARAKGNSEKRKEFLDKIVTIFYGHWGGYWQLYTYPYVNSITFDRNMKYARVDYTLIYEGGEAILKKENDKWEVIESHITWIE